MMSPILRKIIAIISSAIVCLAIAFLVGKLSSWIFPIRHGLDLTISDTGKAYIIPAPVYAKIFDLFVWFLGTFVGVIITGKIAIHDTIRVMCFAGVILFIAIIIYMAILSLSIWLWIAGIILSLIATILAFIIFNRNKTKSFDSIAA